MWPVLCDIAFIRGDMGREGRLFLFDNFLHADPFFPAIYNYIFCQKLILERVYRIDEEQVDYRLQIDGKNIGCKANQLPVGKQVLHIIIFPYTNLVNLI